MYWIIQRDFYSERNSHLLHRALSILGVPYEEVSLNSIHYADPMYFVKNCFKHKQEGIIVCGGMPLMQLAIAQKWLPGCFMTDNFDFRVWAKAYGSDLLNNDGTVSYLSRINPQFDRFFIRPLKDSKKFNGGVITKKEFHAWREGILKKERVDIEVMFAPCKLIYTEIRFFVVDGVIITASQYRSAGHLYVTADIEPAAINFVNSLVRRWNPSRAYVLDIALTPDGYKVVELNNVTSSGFYGCDVVKIVNALNKE
ncbi:hypothetical protein D3C71_1401530 [compost metagenome]